jgi:hypothetical protein
MSGERTFIAKRIFSGYTIQWCGNEWEVSCCLRDSLVDIHLCEVGMSGKKLTYLTE